MKEHSPAADTAARLYVDFLVTGDGQTLLRSAEMGYAYAQYEMYKRERYPALAAARKWLAMAAEGGVPGAIAALAAERLNSHGGEVPMDTLLSAETRELQRIEALVCRYYDSGYYASAMHYAALIPSPQHCSIGPIIGTMYYEGLGTEVDYVQAARFYSWSVADYMDYLGASARTLSLADCRRIAEAHHRRFVAAMMSDNGYDNFPQAWTDAKELLPSSYPSIYRFVAENIESTITKAEADEIAEEYWDGEDYDF